VLRRAFGPPGESFPDPLDGGRAADLASDLRLIERIGARVPSSLLVAELGREAARRLALSRLQGLARVEGLCELVPELVALAAEAGMPIVLLKFAGLRAGGYLREHNATLFMFLLAVLDLYLHRITGGDDLVIGCPIANGGHDALKTMLGLFASPLIIAATWLAG